MPSKAKLFSTACRVRCFTVPYNAMHCCLYVPMLTRPLLSITADPVASMPLLSVTMLCCHSHPLRACPLLSMTVQCCQSNPLRCDAWLSTTARPIHSNAGQCCHCISVSSYPRPSTTAAAFHCNARQSTASRGVTRARSLRRHHSRHRRWLCYSDGLPQFHSGPQLASTG